jgi:hypothetical protein
MFTVYSLFRCVALRLFDVLSLPFTLHLFYGAAARPSRDRVLLSFSPANSALL